MRTGLRWLQSTQPMIGVAVTAVMVDCCAKCVETHAPSNGVPIYHFLRKTSHVDSLDD